jgi:hypothetical protein
MFVKFDTDASMLVHIFSIKEDKMAGACTKQERGKIFMQS